jgi:methylenetetrahydrofolate dehydrogenase (NADP+)/methenyltetrahydrofolate cyclohydrolase
MKLLKGKKIAEVIFEKIKGEIKKSSLQPALAVILVGHDQASHLYVSLKKKAAEKIGIKFRLLRFSEKVKEKEIIQKIKELNSDKKISGLIVQLPLPKNLNTRRIINEIAPQKDVDGFSAKGGSALGGHPSKNSTSLQPVFPQAIMEILASSRVRLKGKKAVVIANSKIFGETMVVALENKKIKADYFLLKNFKNNLKEIKKSDILITACGTPNLIKAEIVKEGVIIVDGGITKKNSRVLGDVDFKNVLKKASFISPVPGGVGPVTIACLLKNTCAAAKKSR